MDAILFNFVTPRKRKARRGTGLPSRLRRQRAALAFIVVALATSIEAGTLAAMRLPRLATEASARPLHAPSHRRCT